MPHSLSQILPSLSSLGDIAYWIIGLASVLESWFLTGVVVPGSLVVEAGGILVQRGTIDFFDLVWFVAIGSILGAEASYWTGILARRGLGSGGRFLGSKSYLRAESLFKRRGGLALVIGRLLGPVSGLVALVAAMTGMERRRFVIWNIVAGFPYAFVQVSIGYFLGEVFSRFGPLLTRVALFGLGLVAGLFVLYWVVSNLARFGPLLKSVGRSVIRAIVENPDVQAWAARHPLLAGQIAARLRIGRFAGLPATFLGLFFVYVLTIWAGSVFDFLTADPILQADMRIANLVHTFWSPPLLKTATVVTAFGDSRVVGAVFGVALFWLVVRGHRALALGLAVATCGDLVAVWLLKAIFNRPRPELAYYVESSNSFPSGHAAISVAFWGMLFYITWRRGRLGFMATVFSASLVALAIGGSRVFLIEHYMTDVANGWLVGGLMLVIGVAIAEWRYESTPRHAALQMASPVRAVAIGLTALLMGYAGWTIISYDKTLNRRATATEVSIMPDLATVLADPAFAATTESLLGNPLEPVNIILLAPDQTTLVARMNEGGWNTAQMPSLRPLARAAWAAWTNQPYQTAPVTPYFWGGEPNDLAFEKPTPDNTLRERHHVRIWATPFLLADGRRVFVGAASYDDGFDPGIYHHIDPNIDNERDTLSADLAAVGATVMPPVAVSEPRLGTSVAGDPWFTDGAAAVIDLAGTR